MLEETKVIVYNLLGVTERVFYPQFWNENGQNVKCARSFIPHLCCVMDRTPFHPFCSQGQNEQNIANAFCTNHYRSRIVNIKRSHSLSIGSSPETQWWLGSHHFKSDGEGSGKRTKKKILQGKKTWKKIPAWRKCQKRKIQFV